MAELRRIGKQHLGDAVELGGRFGHAPCSRRRPPARARPRRAPWRRVTALATLALSVSLSCSASEKRRHVSITPLRLSLATSSATFATLTPALRLGGSTSSAP